MRRDGPAIAARPPDQRKRELPIQRMGNFGVRVYPTLSHPLRMFVGMELRAFVDEEIEPVGVLSVETESSVRFVTSARYQQLPREERPRRSQLSIGRRLDDGVWHGLRRCWWRVHDDGDRQLRLLSDVGPAGEHGIVTGVVLAVNGSWMPADADADDFRLSGCVRPEPHPCSADSSRRSAHSRIQSRLNAVAR